MAKLPEPWVPFSKKYEVHEETIEAFNRAARCNLKPMRDLGVDGARQQNRSVFHVFNGEIDYNGEISEETVPSSFDPNGIPIYIMKPTSCATTRDPIILVYFHGGALVFGSRKSSETALKKISMDCGIIVVNVEYRLLPESESVYAPFEDAETAARWVLDNKVTIGGSTQSKVGVGGECSGGQLAMSVCTATKGLDFQILVYPMADASRSDPSHEEFLNVPGLSEDDFDFLFENSVKLKTDYLLDPRLNPMVSKTKGNSPPTLVFISELDPMRDCALSYAEKLRAEGVRVQSELIKGVPHSFFPQLDTYKSKCREAYGHIKSFLDIL